ncbi:alpha/beta hydrolase [Chromobacterium sp. ATCC 53434]|uniref:alpha/beta hydrolase n=1 Tax=Chromobacterium sp. (strain ATCC 53434 / SC 14030) TaxID=2059672 RepID=UPI000C76180E|nr:alpha/beta hydrolase [Chromobacterium sp. ATCC 53434]AUH52813.1 alpha/beta hydrolase [Chromobacterium sp. ATCC 53434]
MRVWLLLLCCLASLPARSEQVIEIPTRPGVSQRFLLLEPTAPARANLILFTGGEGLLKLSADGELGAGNGNFLVRTRRRWAELGFRVAVVDAPSDMSRGLLGDFRESPEHATDIAAVSDYLRRGAALPVWLAGTSRGTTSAAAVALRRPDAADGLLLTSSIDAGRGNLARLPLERLTMPVLMIQHRRDECRASHAYNLGPVVDRLRADAPRELMLLDGGKNDGDPCEPWAWHGYNGIENRVLDLAGRWMLAHGRR